jgi:hypothetical protein
MICAALLQEQRGALRHVNGLVGRRSTLAASPSKRVAGRGCLGAVGALAPLQSARRAAAVQQAGAHAATGPAEQDEQERRARLACGACAARRARGRPRAAHRQRVGCTLGRRAPLSQRTPHCRSGLT